MRPLRAWPFLVVLLAAACSAAPRSDELAGEYEGPARPPGAAAAESGSEWRPASLELVADGSCWWHPAVKLGPGPRSMLTTLGTWTIDLVKPGGAIAVHFPTQHAPAQDLWFDLLRENGEFVLVAPDGSRLTRKR